MFSLKLISISLISLFVIQSNCAVTPSISTTNAPIQKKSNVVYQFEPSDDSLQPEELVDASTELPHSAETSEIKNETYSSEIPEHEVIVPAEDPQNLYAQNVPLPVNTYNNQFGGPYAPPQNGPVRYYVPPAWIQLLDSIQRMNPPQQGNDPIGYPSFHPTGYSSGFPSNLPPYIDYEGILVPIQNPPSIAPKQKKINQRIPNQIQPSRVNTDLVVLLRNLLPPNLTYFIMHWGSFIVNAISVIALGGLLTSAICTLTPICTLSISSLPLSAAFKRNLGINIDVNNNQTNASTTISRVRRATQLLQTALDKYEQLQRVTGNPSY